MPRSRKLLEFVCNCGVKVVRRADKKSALRCSTCNKKASANISDFIGRQFNNFQVLSDSGERCPHTSTVIWVCSCQCGVVFTAKTGVIRENGDTLSCGCLRYKTNPHRISETPEYKSYYMMLDRCYNQNNPYYFSYGGRGIAVDESWLGVDGFARFLKDMGNRPLGTSIERNDVDCGYNFSNCKWGTDSEQSHTKRKQINTSSKYKGVCKVKSGNFRAYISKGGKRIELGTFACEVNAARLYDCASLIWYGYTSYINFTEDRETYMKVINLAVGQRGHKDAEEDYTDIRDSAQRALDIYKEWN